MNHKYTKKHHYAIEAAMILHSCRKNLAEISDTSGRNVNIVELDRTLLTTEQMLHYHLLYLLDIEMQEERLNRDRVDIRHDEDVVKLESGEYQQLSNITSITNRTILDTVEELKRKSRNNCDMKTIKPETMVLKKLHQRKRSSSFPGYNNLMHPSLSCFIPTKERNEQSCLNVPISKSATEKSVLDSLLFRLIVILQLCLVRIDEAHTLLCVQSGIMTSLTLIGASSAFAATSVVAPSNKKKFYKVASGFACAVGMMMLRKGWRLICMNARLLNSSLTLEDWQQQWTLIQSINLGEDDSEDQCKRLLELIPVQKRSWSSQGTLRYNIIKRVMETLYASVGTALKLTKSESKGHSMLIPVTAAAASYYAFVDASESSERAVSGQSSDNLIRHAWGMVSSPVVKNISLQASRLLKGAAIAERITLGGVSCFILSKNPCPALSLMIKRSHRQEKRISLGTIPEYSTSVRCNKTVNLKDYPEFDVIFHLTGGGFFAHTLAGDIPFLLDWSKATSSIVICPEYSLLPENPFPVAIDEVTKVYLTLLHEESTQVLGFRTKHIIVTGESAGGNLAASLCVKLCMDRHQSILPNIETGAQVIRLPDAMMLCCPVLNLSCSYTPSRIISRDAVLPSSLLKTISKAYLRDHPSTDPIASPFFAPDWVLSLFPPVLLFVSESDPCTDDSVGIHSRLINVGVESDLRAANSLPHAYWGLGTAGFPEAQKMQSYCEQWLYKHIIGDKLK